ncbi:MAG TPA: SRPBCC family protein [Candidatus Thermoplasmatota archaeon]|nr:SRPBCC family protein [Candidatus Thermoplasmatota archaeon]
MPAARWRHEAVLEADPAAVYAWLKDFREDDHARPAFLRGAGIPPGEAPPSARKVVPRDARSVVVEDAWGRRSFRVVATFDDAARAIALEGAYGYRATWRVEEAPGGARVVVEGALAPRGFLGFLVPVVRRSLLREMARDFAGHVEDAREGLGVKR